MRRYFSRGGFIINMALLYGMSVVFTRTRYEYHLLKTNITAKQYYSRVSVNITAPQGARKRCLRRKHSSRRSAVRMSSPSNPNFFTFYYNLELFSSCCSFVFKVRFRGAKTNWLYENAIIAVKLNLLWKLKCVVSGRKRIDYKNRMRRIVPKGDNAAHI